MYNFTIDAIPLTDAEINSAKSAIRNNLALVVTSAVLAVMLTFFGAASLNISDFDVFDALAFLFVFAVMFLVLFNASVRITGFKGFPIANNGLSYAPWNAEKELDPIQ